MLPYLFVCIFVYNIVPIIGKLISHDNKHFLLILNLLDLGIIITCFVISLTYGLINRFEPFQLLFPVFIGILYIPTLLIFNYNIFSIFTVVYIIISLIGSSIGYGIRNLRNEKAKYFFTQFKDSK